MGVVLSRKGAELLEWGRFESCQNARDPLKERLDTAILFHRPCRALPMRKFQSRIQIGHVGRMLTMIYFSVPTGLAKKIHFQLIGSSTQSLWLLYIYIHFLTPPTLDPNRYATRRSGNLPSHASPQAGYDVLRHPFQGHPSYLQKVYAKREFHQSSCRAS